MVFKNMGMCKRVYVCTCVYVCAQVHVCEDVCVWNMLKPSCHFASSLIIIYIYNQSSDKGSFSESEEH